MVWSITTDNHKYDGQSQIDGVRQSVETLHYFNQPKVWKEKKNRFLKFNILDDISDSPTDVVIPLGADIGIEHPFTMVG
jgi:hypothetical protein